MGTQLPIKRGTASQFLAHVCCGQTAGWMKMLLGMEVGRGPGNIVRCGPSLPPLPKRALPAKFSAHACCGETARWIKMPFAGEVGLGPGDIVLDGDPAPRGAQPPPIFGPYLLWRNGWMDQDPTWYEGRPRPRRKL